MTLTDGPERRRGGVRGKGRVRRAKTGVYGNAKVAVVAAAVVAVAVVAVTVAVAAVAVIAVAVVAAAVIAVASVGVVAVVAVASLCCWCCVVVFNCCSCRSFCCSFSTLSVLFLF